MPAEWAPQEATWFSWPLNPKTWPDTRERVLGKLAEAMRIIAEQQLVYINCIVREQAAAERILIAHDVPMDKVRFFDIPTDDAWCRDHGPTIVKETASGERLAIDWHYNAWGGKFEPWNHDDAAAARCAQQLEIPSQREDDFICEGGAIEVNGKGLLLTTESVLLNPNRNPDLGRSDIEAIFRCTLGVEQICWLPAGLDTDDTDGHIDTITRFCNEQLIVTCTAKDSRDPNYRQLAENKERLGDLQGIEVVDLPLPEEPIMAPAWREERLPATYANFLIINGAVLVPTYQQAKSDDRACGILRELFTKHEVIGVDCLDILLEGGAIHCLSQQVPL